MAISERLRQEVESWYREGMHTEKDDNYSAELERYETQTGISYDYSWDW